MEMRKVEQTENDALLKYQETPQNCLVQHKKLDRDWIINIGPESVSASLLWSTSICAPFGDLPREKEKNKTAVNSCNQLIYLQKQKHGYSNILGQNLPFPRDADYMSTV